MKGKQEIIEPANAQWKTMDIQVAQRFIRYNKLWTWAKKTKKHTASYFTKKAVAATNGQTNNPKKRKVEAKSGFDCKETKAIAPTADVLYEYKAV
mmetsp:Transcript_40496/g.53311  ORF Transcript_40496/g.53311 Transcript_40496/m.53311 type:complete len:95 (+) Transcript_40496:334-618(+)|eukprot:CAMPEP_0117775434 /NCGR_PEP_ID=MMETSP0947-20121206/27141_1 /TAXON_ID=44440 /ORGANISM="Chattonella subsalsa, Strain CCMP2191" /LENGTH=94 /DNA_ID=CAMNT_0005602151 /DNA_START=268 /DNA_END=552 /DNA_ORIENTATION=+